MNRALAVQVADAILYEGYMLYPYRPSAIKNRQRWSFGILYPPDYPEIIGGTERCLMHSEVLLEGASDARVEIQLRFLHLLARQVSQLAAKSADRLSEPDQPPKEANSERAGDSQFVPVLSLLAGERRIESWDEGMERVVNLELGSLTAAQQICFRFPGYSESEMVRGPDGQLAGIVSHTQQEVNGSISASSQTIREGLYKLTITVSNTTGLPLDARQRDSALMRCLLSAHTILAVTRGSFVSLLDPPAELCETVADCRNVGNFPVLAGSAPECDLMLCSPIILYDYPQIAPESTANFFDSTEMDEMLTLRILTLTGEEKQEMRLADDHARQLLERTEQSARQQLTKTHGTIRDLHRVGDKLGENL